MAPENPAEEERGPELVAWGLSFARAEVEEAYQKWRMSRTLAQARAGLGLAFVAWGLFLAGMLATGLEGVGTAVVPVAAIAVPASALALLASYGDRTRGWFLPLSAGANAVGGLAIIAFVRAVPFRSVPNFAPLVGLCALVICAYFAFTVQRLRPRDAAIAAGVYLVAYGATMIDWYRHEEIARAILAGTISALAASLLTGIFACCVAERLSRSAFRQEGIIDAQRATIARERARSEELLEQELAHQVAARSRDLGRMLAQVEGAIARGRPAVGGRFASRYRVLRELGAGGMGAVYEVERVTDQRRLALKVVTGDVSTARAARFAREAEIGARIHHPNLASIVDVGVDESGVPFLAMELAPDGTLEDRRAEFGVGDWARPILAGIARGVVALHQAGVVHRDLKPANVLLVTDEGGTAVAKISDFGISRFGSLESLDVDPGAPTMVAARTHGITATGMLLGTPNYMAPETTTSASVETPSDVFAFAILAGEVLTGRAPFAHPPMFSVLAGERLRAPSGLDDERIPPPLRELLRAALREEPGERPSMRALCQCLAELDAAPGDQRRSSRPEVARSGPVRRRPAAARLDDEGGRLPSNAPERVTEDAAPLREPDGIRRQG